MNGRVGGGGEVGKETLPPQLSEKDFMFIFVLSKMHQKYVQDAGKGIPLLSVIRDV